MHKNKSKNCLILKKSLLDTIYTLIEKHSKAGYASAIFLLQRKVSSRNFMRDGCVPRTLLLKFCLLLG